MKKYVCLSLVSLLSIPLVMSCKRGGSGEQNRYTETFDPVSVGQVQVSMNLENKIKIEDTYNKIKANTFVLKGTYSNCFGKADNEEWNLDDTSNERLIIKKGDTNCELKITGFSVKNSNSVIAEYTVSAESSKLTQKFSDNPIVFNLKSNSAEFSPIIYSVANITPVDFSANPIISIVISELFTVISNYETPFTRVEIFVPTIDTNRNILVNSVPVYSVDSTKFEVHHDFSNKFTFYNGHYIFINTKNPAQEYLVVDSSKDLSSYEKVDAYFKAIKTDTNPSIKNKIKAISSNNITIASYEITKNGSIPQLFPSSGTVSFKVIFAKSLDAAPNFYSYSVYTNNIIKK
ncbi:hypothetical protein QEJ31_06515 [Pigmentibacter sp. JX0631]|uniref:hypothetical protein n=1 Tax=Pigmentibacter sp. JX0631 TaxID=2976982 RepID=UPI002468E70A|nr:hypothetical protein [Pigmentibacter sp. JX0631]WGL61243.1 hypothetical protein QEJ31_06515 [Pigmentibacter sp. JX0631]